MMLYDHSSSRQSRREANTSDSRKLSAQGPMDGISGINRGTGKNFGANITIDDGGASQNHY